MPQVLTLDQCPESVQAYFLSMPGFQQAMKITKSTSVDTGTIATVTKTLKTSRHQQVKKAANLPGFAQILAGSMGRDIGTPAPAIPVAPAPTVKPFPAPTDTPATSVGKPSVLGRASNTPKTPIPSKGESVTLKDLRSAIDTALHERAQREQAERFNAGRSAFSRIAKTQEHHVQGGGRGDAWSLRNIGGKLVSAVLNGTARKTDGKPVGASALDVAFGRGR